MAIRAVVWGENIHEHTNAVVRDTYPDGMHSTIAAALNAGEGIHRPDASQLRACLKVDVENAVWKDIEVDPVETNYQKFIAAIRDGHMQEASFRHAANLQKILDLALITERERRELAV